MLRPYDYGCTIDSKGGARVKKSAARFERSCWKGSSHPCGGAARDSSGGQAI